MCIEVIRVVTFVPAILKTVPEKRYRRVRVAPLKSAVVPCTSGPYAMDGIFAITLNTPDEDSLKATPG